MMSEVDLTSLVAHLKATSALNSYSGKGEPPEYATAYAIAEITCSARKLVSLFQTLTENSDPEKCKVALEEYREEIRHILYHIRDCEYLAIVSE